MRTMRAVADSWAETRGLKRVGFWRSDEEPELPHPADSVDPAWRVSEGEQVLLYLKEAYGLPYHYLGFSWCRVGCPGIPNDIGSDDLTDGTYLFPEGLAHYVRLHAVRPPTEFLEHLRANNYHVPKLRTRAE